MKILWVSNSPIGPAASILSEEYKGSSGGWIQSEYESLDKSGTTMFFLCFAPNVKYGDRVVKENSIGRLYAIGSPKLQYGVRASSALVRQVEQVVQEVSPDVIQIWGTETCLSHAVSQCAPKVPKVIFIQGLLGVHQRYLGGYFSKKSLPWAFRGVSILAKTKAKVRKKLFSRQAEIERETIRNCKNVIIDGEFAEAYCRSICDDVKCYCHVLKPNQIFKEYKWSYEDAVKHRIFTVYGGSAEKGVQNLLLAVGILKQKYPDIQVLIPGNYHLSPQGQLIPSNKDEFERVLANMIRVLKLEDNIVFTGRLNVREMAENISHSHVFVNPSCMEVHALSLREAMSMGVPSVSSLCGSVGGYVKHMENGLIYRYEEYEVLALYLDRLFEDADLCNRISDAAVCVNDAYKRDTSESLNSIYQSMISDKA